MNAEDEKRVREIVKEEMCAAATKKMLNRSFLIAAAISFSLAMFVDEIFAAYLGSLPANMAAGFVAFDQVFFGAIGSIAAIAWLFFNTTLADVA